MDEMNVRKPRRGKASPAEINQKEKLKIYEHVKHLIRYLLTDEENKSVYCIVLHLLPLLLHRHRRLLRPHVPRPLRGGPHLRRVPLPQRIFIREANPQCRLSSLCGRKVIQVIECIVIQKKWNRLKMGNKGFGDDVYLNFLRKQVNAITFKLFNKDYFPLSTHIYRVPQCMSPRRNWDSPAPLSRQRVSPSSRNQKGEGVTLPCG
jgi:hypothetical protein